METADTTNTLSKETEKKLIDFFNKSVDPKVMAKAIRQLNYIIALGVMREHETLQNNIKAEKLWKNYYVKSPIIVNQ